MQFFSDQFLGAAANAKLYKQYYDICKRHPNNTSERVKVPVREVLSAARGKLLLSKLKGPGTAYSFDGLPDGYDLVFILYSTGSVQGDFSANYRGEKQSGPLTMLARSASLAAGLPEPNPPYQRPDYRSIDELISVFGELGALMDEIINL